METIFKYPLKDRAEIVQEIELYQGSSILSAIEQDRQIVVYALTNPESMERRKFTFQVIGTGWNHEAMNIDLRWFAFLDTVKIGEFVWHVFWK